MKLGKYKNINTKVVVLILVLILAVGVVIGGTAAWLSAKTDPVVNTFTYGDINITLIETDTDDGDDDPNTNKYKMMPGQEIAKDPKITVLKGSEDSWLFVKLEKSENFDDFLEYEIAEGWTALEDQEGVYFRTVAYSDEDQEFDVIKDDTVIVKENVTKEMLNALDSTEDTKYPTLTITAYAVQYDAEIEAIDSASKAWSLITEKQDADNENTADAG